MSSHEKFTMREAVVVLKRIKIIGCKKCSKGFTNFRDYKFHKLKHQLQNIQKQRKEKNKKYYTPNSAGFEKSLKCDECDMKFVEKSTLTAHSALHKPYPHVCECGVGFYVSEDLKCHMKIVHADEDDTDQPKAKKQKKSQKENILVDRNKKIKSIKK